MRRVGPIKSLAARAAGCAGIVASAMGLAGLALALLWPAPARAAPWADALRAQVERIDRETPGELGVYVKHLASGETMAHQADRPWYLGSTLKVPIALAVLEEVQAGRHALGERVTLQPQDRVDGSGPLVWQKAGTRRTVAELLQGMLVVSDNTAANMLVRTIGADTFVRHAQAELGLEGFGRLTDFTQVRRDVYAQLHPRAATIPNQQLVEIAAAPMGPARVNAVRRVLAVPAGALAVPTIDEAYARYYAGRPNSATLVSYGGMLERLVQGRLLGPELTGRMFTLMKFDRYDAYRLEAGLPRSVRFIHKTGTQWQRACHAGVIEPQDDGRHGIVVVACAEGLDEQREAGRVFEQVGEAITATLLGGGNGR